MYFNVNYFKVADLTLKECLFLCIEFMTMSLSVFISLLLLVKWFCQNQEERKNRLIQYVDNKIIRPDKTNN